MNYIAIDPSLISTAMIIYNSETSDFKIFNYCREKDAMGKNGMFKWFKSAEQFIEYRFIKYRSFDDYSTGELVKLKDYDQISDMIIDDINGNIDVNSPSVVGIEGFNFGAQVGDLIDLVAFSILLRKKIFDSITEEILVLSPSTLKLESCKMTYTPIEKKVGKNIKIEYRNNIGMAGGKFTKRDIFYAIIENENFNDYWAKHLKLNQDDLLEPKNIQKPYEDVNDAYIIMKHLIQVYATYSINI